MNEKKRKDPNADIFSDTSGWVLETFYVDWSKIYAIFDNSDFFAITHDQLVYAKISNSYLHRIAARSPFMPYMDMVMWELDDVSPEEWYFDDHAHTQVASFHLDIFAR